MAGRPIDEKIVAMKMDNSDFVRKASETTSIFGKIQQAMGKVTGVDMTKVADSFGAINGAAQKVDLSSISNKIDTISSRFSNLGIVATTALANIANKAVNAGTQLLKSLTVQPLMDGFREYENKMGSIGTMLANTEWAGSTLDDVKKTLGELNDYADNTIYSFEQMTANIGRFTAAGVTLEDSATAIKGLGNLAAVSGSNVDQLNTVMYQMSQALAAGKLNLMDWNSLVNGGMAGKKTQDALVATAKAMGKNVDLTDGFRNSIQQGWLTSEVFLETLKKFGKDKSMTEAATSVRTFTGMIAALKEGVGSGWAETWELMFGDFEQATKRWTALSEVIGGFFQRGTDARNKFVKAFADAGVFSGFFNIIVNTGKAVLDVFDAIGRGISKAFSGTNTGFIEGLGKAINKFADSIKFSEKTLNTITTIFQALFSVVNLVFRAFVGLAKIVLAVVAFPINMLIFLIKELSLGILGVVGYIGKLVLAFTDGIKTGEALTGSVGFLQKAFSTIGSVIGKTIKGISKFATNVREAWKILSSGEISKNGPWDEDSEIVSKLFWIRDAVIEFVSGVREAWSILVNGEFTGKGPWEEDSKIVDRLFKIRQAVWDFCSGVVEAWNIMVLGKNTGLGPWDKDAEIVDKLFKIREAVQDFANGVIEAYNILIKGDFTGVGPWDEDSKIVDRLFDIREGVIDFANGVIEAWNILAKGDFTGVGPWEEDSVIVDKLFDMREAVIKFGEAIQETWSIVVGGKFSGVGPWSEDSAIVKGLFKIREGFQSLGKFVSTLDFSLLLVPLIAGFGAIGHFLSTLDFSGLFVTIANGFAWITKSVSEMKVNLEPVGNFFKGIFDGIGNGIDWVINGFKKMGAAIKEHMPSGNQLFAGGFIAGLIAIVGLVTKVWWDLYQVFTGWGKIGQGVTDVLDSVSGALNSFTASVYANALLTIAIALGVLAIALWGLSKIDHDKVTTGLYGLIGVMTAMITGMAIMNKYDIQGTGMSTALQMVVMAGAVLIMVSALKKLGDMNIAEIGKGILGLVGIMGTMAGAMVLMSRFGGAKVGASALQMIAIAAAVHLLFSAVKKIAEIDTDVLVKGLKYMAIALLELGLFLAIAGRTKFGLSAGLGLVAVAYAIGMITESMETIGKMDVDVLKQGLTTIAQILLAVTLFAAITGVTGLLKASIGLVIIAGALTALIVPITILGSMPFEVLAQGLGALAVALLAIGAASLMMGNMLVAGAGLLLLAVAMNMLMVPIAAFAAMPLSALAIGIGALAIGILAIGGAAALLGLAAPALLLGAAGIGLLGIAMLAAGVGMSLFATGLMTLATLTAGAVTTIVAVLGTLLVGLASLIPTAVDFMVKIIMQMAKAIADNTPILVGYIVDMLIGMLNAIGDRIPDFVDAAVKIITNFLDAMARNLPKIVDSAANLMVAFVESLASAVETNGPKFLDAIMRLMAEVMVIVVQAGVAVIQALFGWIPGVTEATNEIGETAEQTIRDAFGAEKAAKDKGKDFADGLNSTKGNAKTAGTNIGNSAESGADSANLTTIGSGHGTDFATALGNKAGTARAEGLDLANAGKSGAGSVSMNSTGNNFGQGFASGISGAWNSVVSAAKSLARSASNAVKDWLDIHSPSRLMRKDGGFFGEGLALGIGDKAKLVAEKAKGLAMTARDSLNRFIDGFELPEEDNELRFKAVIDYDQLDTSRFGNVASMRVRPDVSLTNGLVTATKAEFRQNVDKTPRTVDSSTTTTTNQYQITVEDKGYKTRGEIRKLAEQIQTEIKNINDRGKISRGEGVVF